MREFACIARCNGARVQVWRDGQRLIRRDKGEQQPKEDASPKDESSKQTVSSSNEDVLTSIEHFRMHIRNSCAVSCQRTPGCESGFIAVSYDRSVLGQTGSGHFSPIGAYHEGDPEKNEPDRVLILDCARFKYPPHWCTVQDLYDAMNTIDPDTGAKRGWAIISRAPSFELQTSLSVKLSPHYSITELSQHFENLLNDASKLIQHETDIDLVLKQLLDLLHKHLDGFVHLSAEGCTLCGDKGCKCISQETSEKNGEPTKANNQSALRDTTPDCCPNKGDIDDEEYLTFSLKTLIYEAKGTKLFQKLKLLDEKCEMKDLILHTVILLAIPFKTYGLLNQVSGEMKELCNIQGTTNFLEREVATLKSQVLTLLNYDSPECDGGSDDAKGRVAVRNDDDEYSVYFVEGDHTALLLHDHVFRVKTCTCAKFLSD
eukprot:CAMPEP_0117436742 /NCGR_PEP_ID=MMETSP0759-20121206/1164_1 /TAXON_ID=63605 /ORGANISM="Percolomonas cosmopolitus, Strain WS" /LENGTH=429 /DNA_ID=CAMNT_0005228351 /DNA_START=364 /DNA_END=1654 /DNA_ORIENTATION=+